MLFTVGALTLGFASPVHVILGIVAAICFLAALCGWKCFAPGGWIPVGLILIALCFVFV